MGYRILTDLALVTHLAFLGYVVLAALVVLVSWVGYWARGRH